MIPSKEDRAPGRWIISTRDIIVPNPFLLLLQMSAA